MTRVILSLEITETGKLVQVKNLVLENKNPLIISTNFFLSPHLSISLYESSQPNTITFCSQEVTTLFPEAETLYSYTYFGAHRKLIPDSGSYIFFLQKGDTFSITKTQKDYYQVIKAKVILIDQTPHEEPTFPEEFHISP